MSFTLKTRENKIKRNGPLLIIIMDGIGIGRENEENAVFLGNTPMLNSLMKNSLNTSLYAHGPYVGLPSDEDMGNSEVGHNAIGAGRVYEQGAKLVNKSIKEKSLYKGKTWQKLINNCKTNNSALHFIGLLSDGNVHSHINQLKELIKQASSEGIKKCFLHALLDGRDVDETSAPKYIKEIEDFFKQFNQNGNIYKIASGGGRMKITMDRYEADWNMIELGWKIHVCGEGRQFSSALEAIQTLRQETEATDQFMDPFVIAENGKPVGKINNHDSVIFFNFRGDRAIEISKAFEDKNLNTIKRDYIPVVEYAGIMEYDGDLHIPKQYLVSPPSISNTMSEYLVNNNIKLFAVSETQKYGHVTYFWNGNRSGKIKENMEEYVEIPSDLIPFEQRPWMKAAQITDKVIDLLKSGKFQHGRLNLANGDMVGHTGSMNATRIAVETVDICLQRILKVIDKLGGIAIITADHGNADEMYDFDRKTGQIKIDKETGIKKVKTSHTLNKVPFIIYDPSYNNEYIINKNLKNAGLSNIASTVFNLLGFYPPEDFDESIITLK